MSVGFTRLGQPAASALQPTLVWANRVMPKRPDESGRGGHEWPRVAGAEVKAVQAQTNLEYRTTTNGAGLFVLLTLPPRPVHADRLGAGVQDLPP